MTRTLDVGLIGYGLGGANFHAPFIAGTAGMRLSAVVTRDPVRRALAGERYPDAQLVDDVDALLATKPDVVAISTPNATHFPLAKRALEAGCHVVVDKPFAGTAAEARDLAGIAARAGRLAIPFQNRRWDGDYLTLRKLMDDGVIGHIYRFESRFDRWRPVRKPGWCRADAAASLENIVHDLGTHLVDQALQLFGPVTRVYAELRKIDPAIVTSDDMFISLTHASGTQSHLGSTMQAGIAGPRYHAMGLRGSYVKFGVDPQEGMLRTGMAPGSPGYGDEPEELWGIFGSGDASAVVPTEVGDYSPFYAGVASAVNGASSPPVTAESVLRQLEVVDAVFESARRGEAVSI